MWMCNDRKKNFAAWLNILMTGTHTPLYMYWNRRHPNSQMSSHCFHLVRTFEGKILLKNVLSISAITPPRHKWSISFYWAHSWLVLRVLILFYLFKLLYTLWNSKNVVFIRNFVNCDNSIDIKYLCHAIIK